MRGLRWLLAGEGLNSGAVMLALTTPFILFLDELGFSKSQIGLLNSLIHLTAPLALIIAPAVERFGLKRTYLTFMSTRNAVLCCMVLLPWMIADMGFDFAFMCAIGLMGMYGLLRVIAEIALYPWMVEAIPNSVRGRFSAVSSMVSTATRLGAVLVSGYVIGQYTGLWRYQTLIAVGCCLGLASVLVRWKVLGGEPQRARVLLNKGDIWDERADWLDAMYDPADFDWQGTKDAFEFLKSSVQYLSRRGFRDSCLQQERPKKRIRLHNCDVCGECLLKRALE